MAKSVEQLKDNVPANYQDEFAGDGTFTDQQHTITPQIKILQGLSPQVKRSNAGYIEGAAPGMIYLMNHPSPLIDGEKGILFQPAWFKGLWEIRTDKERVGAANYVAVEDEPLNTWKKIQHNGNFDLFRTPDGHVASLVHMHVGLLHLENLIPYAIKFGGTGMWVSRNWNGLIGNGLTPSGAPAARYGFVYRMRVKTQVNAVGEWGQWSIQVEGPASREAMLKARELRKAMEDRSRTVDHAADEHEYEEPQGDDAPM